jgi:hypothetical protein
MGMKLEDWEIKIHKVPLTKIINMVEAK